ncbi:MAG: WD40 repeat domain-containing protein [Bacillota bacterium]
MPVFSGFPSGGKGLPQSWINRVTAPALESIAENAAVKYALTTDLSTSVTKIANPATLPTSDQGHIALSIDGLVMVAVNNGSSGSTSDAAVVLYYYSRATIADAWTYNGTITKDWAQGSVMTAHLSPTGEFFLICGYFGAYLYRRVNGVFESLGKKSVGTSYYRGCISPNGEFLMFIQHDAPYTVTVLKINAAKTDYEAHSTFTGNGTALWISCDNLRFYTSSSNSIGVYTRTGTSYSAADTIPAAVSSVTCLDISASGRFVAFGKNSAPGLVVRRVDAPGVILTLTNTDSSTGWCHGARFTPDEKHIVAIFESSPYLRIYSIGNTAITKLANPSIMPLVPGFYSHIGPVACGCFAFKVPASPFLYSYSFPISDGISNLKGLDNMALIGNPHFKGIGIAKNGSSAFGNVTVELFDPIKNALGGMA